MRPAYDMAEVFLRDSQRLGMEASPQDVEALAHLFELCFFQGASAQRTIALLETGYSVAIQEMDVPVFNVRVPPDPKKP